jgi:tetratricopeptide (TPR) repeat protein
MSGLVPGSDVFPQDWLLWNRVGATLANSGHADQALEYYSQALQMNPMYIRARYNMGIALANLKARPSSIFVHGQILTGHSDTVTRLSTSSTPSSCRRATPHGTRKVSRTARA